MKSNGPENAATLSSFPNSLAFTDPSSLESHFLTPFGNFIFTVTSLVSVGD
jgi:hypothetical protein